MAKNFFYRVVCIDGKGWEKYAPEALWGFDHCHPANRIFATAKEAWEVARSIMGAGCWEIIDTHTDEIIGEAIPEIGVEKCSIYEACWMDDDQEDEINRIIKIHGGPIKFAAMPKHVAEFLFDKFGTRYAGRLAEIIKLFAGKV